MCNRINKSVHISFRLSLCLFLLVSCAFIAGCTQNTVAQHLTGSESICSDTNSSPSSDSSQTTPADVSSASSTENESLQASKEDQSSKPSTSSAKPSNSYEPSSSKNSSSNSKPSYYSDDKISSNNSSVDLSGMVFHNGEYFDRSMLTFTPEDIGKVVGYSPMFEKDIIVFEVDETPTVDGRRCVRLILGYRGDESGCYSPSGFCTVECKYCHEFPCPNGGKTSCSNYDPLKDAAVTCQTCGRPTGNGYYGTCHRIVNWNDPTKPFISCNHYSNCLNCGKPVGDGYNGTCHVTWGERSGETTCNYYD